MSKVPTLESMPAANCGASLSAYKREVAELSLLSQQLADCIPDWDPAVVQKHLDFPEGDPIEMERRLEESTSCIRQAWLTAAAKHTSQSFRSPKACDTPTTPRGKEHKFGYERELCPIALERRCALFFEAPPAGIYCEHVLFSSGQAAMTACLLTSSSSANIAHLGGYFETPQLIALLRSSCEKDVPERLHTLIAEPVWFDGAHWGKTDLTAVREREPDRVIIDATLSGLRHQIEPLLSALSPSTEVFRLHSALKLFQHGLELADVGIVTVFNRSAGGARSLANALRGARALCGLGLRFAEIAALELPAFLNRDMTLDYQDAIFAHNARLAKVVEKSNRLFDDDIYPAVAANGARAPYCTLRLRKPSDSAYERLEQRIQEGAAKEGILLECGGSFGFRGHRYEIVRPETAPTFVRVALGRRPGASMEGAIKLFESIAGLCAI